MFQEFLTTVGGVFSEGVQPASAATAFSANNAATTGNYLSAGDAAGLRIILTDTFITGGWIRWTSNVDAVPFTKGDVNAGTESYGMFITGASGSITASVHNGTSDTTVDSADPIVINTKAFVVMWHDGTNLNIKINAGSTASVVSARTNIADPGGNFTLFSNDDSGALGTECSLDEWFFCKNPADMPAALAVVDSIYNSGTGIRYADLSAGNKTTLGLVSWWTLDDASASNRADAHGANTLTLNGTITRATALVA